MWVSGLQDVLPDGGRWIRSAGLRIPDASRLMLQSRHHTSIATRRLASRGEACGRETETHASRVIQELRESRWPNHLTSYSYVFLFLRRLLRNSRRRDSPSHVKKRSRCAFSSAVSCSVAAPSVESVQHHEFAGHLDPRLPKPVVHGMIGSLQKLFPAPYPLSGNATDL